MRDPVLTMKSATRVAAVWMVGVVLFATGCGGANDKASSSGGGGARKPAAGGPGVIQPRGDVASSPENDAPYVSTFALDVDTASYGYAQRAILEGRRPDPQTVRPEEFVNQFGQDYPEPAGNGFSVTVDGARLAGADQGDVRLMRVGLRTRAESEEGRRDANLTFVIDTSGSMAEPGRLDLVKDALHELVYRLRPTDEVAIVAYESQARLVTPMTATGHKDELYRAIDSLKAGSRTNLEAGVRLGYREARRSFREGATNRVVLASDGLANVGATTSGPILRRVSREAAAGISLLCIGVGSNYGDRLMEELADHGNGRAIYVAERERARRLFVEQLPATVDLRARDAKAQVAFDPAQVDSFRLIGYDDRGLRPQDFRNDAADGGEIGPGHSVTALYVIRLRSGAVGRVADVMVRWQDPDRRVPQETGRTASATDLSAALWSDSSPRLRVDAVAAFFAEHVRDGAGTPPRSPYVRPSHGPFVTSGRVPGEQDVPVERLAAYADDLAALTDDSDVEDLANLISRWRTL